ncbi:MAG: hypothetical protein ASARMPRED_001248 [Alectoria sarmentosa]|nr:MAG: hypothetical protein ASARMPRED_001248 [Alectoria sarmentosa]
MLSLECLNGLTARRGIEENKTHFWGNDPSALLKAAETSVADFTVGSSLEIYTSAILPALESAQYEILFVTCFWARSASLEKLCSALIKLSNRAHSLSTGTYRLRVRLCFSSRSLTQKLLHTSSAAGYVYPPSKWRSLGLPPPEDLKGLDLQVKSLFVLPFSVMHPKFVIIDRQRVLLPSCNVSWESWLECCLPLTGPIVNSFVRFWHHTWGCNDWPDLPATPLPYQVSSAVTTHTAVFLPSPHHCEPHFRPLPFISFAPPPPTPLNTLLLHLFSRAQDSIVLLTPNLTSPPVISALLQALSRGVNVTVITNRRMMIIEQLITSGTITEICVWKLRWRYNRMSHQKLSQCHYEDPENGGDTHSIGSLQIGYFRPTVEYKRTHIKCSTIDNRVVVLGSGNMDRASWYTSQELGVAIEGEEVVTRVREAIEGSFEEEIWQGAKWV